MSSNEKEALYNRANQAQDHLWVAIDSGTFPVGLPFATILPVLFEIGCFAGANVRPSHEKITAVLKNTAKIMTKEDLRFYGNLLNSWLDESRDADSALVASVMLVAGMVRTENLEPLLPTLVLFTCRNNRFSCLDEKEANLIQSWEPKHQAEFLVRYADWLESAGYPILATRTRSFVTIQEKATKKSFFGFRKNVTNETHAG